MRRSVLAGLAMLACLGVALPAASTASTAPATVVAGIAASIGTAAPAAGSFTSRALEVSNAPVHVSRRAAGEQMTLNWSGYGFGSRTPITGVTTTYVQPTWSLKPAGFSAAWAGIGGYVSDAQGNVDPTLIQAGTEADPPGFGPSQYYAWFELLPASEQMILGCTRDAACTVRPGDRMSVVISQLAATRWAISISNAGKWSWRTTVNYTSSRLSAEWILEAPTYGAGVSLAGRALGAGAQTWIDGLGTVRFTGPNTFTAARRVFPMGAANPDTIVLDGAEALPGPIAANRSSFDACTYRTSCS